MTARSVLASTLLGSEPPRLPVAYLVRVGALFGFADGTVRTALSRMAAAGEVVAEGDGRYRLGERLAQRQRRQVASRSAATAQWSGEWRMAVVASGGRPAPERHELRNAMTRARFGELRDGVWLRPDNLGDAHHAVGADVLTWFGTRPHIDPAALARTLWDLGGWAERAAELRAELAVTHQRLARGDLDALAPGFVLSAAVLRHFLADPLLPAELLDGDWPGPGLRRDYDEYDRLFRQLLSSWTAGAGEGIASGSGDTVALCD